MDTITHLQLYPTVMDLVVLNIHRLSGPDLQVSICSKLYFVLVFKCLYADYQDHTYKLVHVVFSVRMYFF